MNGSFASRFSYYLQAVGATLCEATWGDLRETSDSSGGSLATKGGDGIR